MAAAAVVVINSMSVSAQKPAKVQDVVDAELAFARTTAQVGVRDGFLRYIDDNGVLFRPRAVNGKQYLSAQPPRVDGFLLDWRPEYADISAAGDMAYTTGPWTIRKTAQDTAVAYGQFNTVWLRQPSGEYKFLIDTGVSHGKVAEHSGEYVTPPPHARVTGGGTTGSARAAIDSVARLDSALTRDINAARDLTSRMLPHARVTREGALPQTGPAAPAALAEPSHALATRVLGGRVAQSGDLAYTYGEYVVPAAIAGAAAEEGNYMRIWTRAPGVDWKLALDVRSPAGN